MNRKVKQASTVIHPVQKNFKLIIQYDGTDFKGWQIQKNGERTVQAEMTMACEKIFKHPVSVIASGRTDSGVHAKAQVVSVKAKTRMKAAEVLRALNSHLPPDCAVLDAKEMRLDFHAQLSAKEKTYVYRILNTKIRQPLLLREALFFPYDLNISLMKKGAKYLVGKHDFKSLQAHDPLRADKETVRTIKRIVIKRKGDIIEIYVTADGFLYKMVRNIAGILLAVGCKQMLPQQVKDILLFKDRTKAPKTAPAHGLSLWEVKY